MGGGGAQIGCKCSFPWVSCSQVTPIIIVTCRLETCKMRHSGALPGATVPQEVQFLLFWTWASGCFPASYIQSGHWIFFFKPWLWNPPDFQAIDKGRSETRALSSVLTTCSVVYSTHGVCHHGISTLLASCLCPTTVPLFWGFFMKNNRSPHCVIYIFSGLNALWKCFFLVYRG